jgi:hypothetical protein
MRTLIALAMVSSSVALDPQTPQSEVAQGGRYESSNGSVIEALGGCRIGVPDSVSCWDLAGKPDEELSRQVKAGLLSSANDISFRFGREIKCIVFRRPQPLGLNYQTTGGRHMNSMYLQRGSDEKQFDLLFPRFDEDVDSVDIQVNLYNVGVSKQVDIPFRKGEKARFEGMELELGVAAPYKLPKPPAPSDPNMARWNGGMGYVQPPFNGVFYPDSKLWIFGVGYQALPDRSLISSLAALDKQGKPIHYVDKNGEPVPSTDVLAANPPSPYPYFQPNPNPNPNAKPPKHRNALIAASNQDVAGAIGYVMNVNPDRIGAIRLFSATNRIVRFEKIPLDVKTP